MLLSTLTAVCSHSSMALAWTGWDVFRCKTGIQPPPISNVQDRSFRSTMSNGQHPGRDINTYHCSKCYFLRSACPQTVPEELQNGGGFGYVVAFRPFGTISWMQTVVASPDAARYVFRNESLPPFSPYEVKVGVYNNKGEGSFSPVTVVYSAEEGRARSPPHHLYPPCCWT